MFSDWFAYFWPQIVDPWQVHFGIYNLPWLFIVLQPLRILGPLGSVIFVQLVSIIVIFRLGVLLRIPKIRMLFVIFSAPVIWNIFMGQIDGIMMAAYILPQNWAISFALFKPQACLGAGWRALRKNLSLVILAVLLLMSAWIIWGWPFSIQEFVMGSTISDNPWDWSMWPFGLVLLPIFFIKDWRGPLFASPFLLPYSGLQSLIGPMLAFATLPWWAFGLIWFGTWLRLGYILQVSLW